MTKYDFNSKLNDLAAEADVALSNYTNDFSYSEKSISQALQRWQTTNELPTLYTACGRCSKLGALYGAKAVLDHVKGKDELNNLDLSMACYWVSAYGELKMIERMAEINPSISIGTADHRHCLALAYWSVRANGDNFYYKTLLPLAKKAHQKRSLFVFEDGYLGRGSLVWYVLGTNDELEEPFLQVRQNPCRESLSAMVNYHYRRTKRESDEEMIGPGNEFTSIPFGYFPFEVWLAAHRMNGMGIVDELAPTYSNLETVIAEDLFQKVPRVIADIHQSIRALSILFLFWINLSFCGLLEYT